VSRVEVGQPYLTNDHTDAVLNSPAARFSWQLFYAKKRRQLYRRGHLTRGIMDKNEFEQFETETIRLRTVNISEMQNLAPRTLLLGVGWRDETVHVYIDPVEREIHVLRYVTVGAGESEQMRVLSHTQGPNGGVTSNAYLVPEKGHYPEFCDYEFCALLRSYGVSLRFTKFDPMRHTLAGQHGRYAGPIWAPELPRATSLRPAVLVEPPKLENVEVLCELLQEACVAADVSYVIVNGDGMVAEGDLPRAVVSANAFLSSMTPASWQHPAEIMKAICTATMWMPVQGCMDDYALEKGGNYVFSYMFDDASIIRDLPDVTRYDTSDYRTALLGTHEGRPYLLVYEYPDWEGIQGHVHVSLFGDVDKFVADMTSRYQLVPAAED
jgi:hypothetical protein